MRVLVTGSSGFVGHALAERLRSLDHEVIGLSRRHRDGHTVQADLLDPDEILRVLRDKRPEVVFHLAARTALKGGEVDFTENSRTTANLLAAIAQTPEVRRAIWMSSQLVKRPGSLPIDDTDYDPPDAYGVSKVEAERLVRGTDGADREWVIARSTTIWGPGMSEHYAGVIRMIARGLYFHIGRRPLRKSYSYIDNLAMQLAALATAPREQVHRRTFYLADSEPIELRAWADRFAAAYGRTIPTMPEPLARMAGTLGDLIVRCGQRSPITSDRVRNVLTEYIYPTAPIENVCGPTRVGWREGVDRTVAWLKSS